MQIQPVPSAVVSAEPNISPVDSQVAQPTLPVVAAQVGDIEQVQEVEVKQPTVLTSSEQPAPSAVTSAAPNISPVESQVTQPTPPPPLPPQAQGGDSLQMQEIEVKQPTAQPLTPSAATSSEPNISPVESQVTQPIPPPAAQVGDSQQQQVTEMQEQTDIIVDKHPQQHEDVVKATLNDVIDMHDLSAGSDTDDAPEVISDSLSRDRDATNQHDQPQPSVCHGLSIIITSLSLTLLTFLLLMP